MGKKVLEEDLGKIKALIGQVFGKYGGGKIHSPYGQVPLSQRAQSPKSVKVSVSAMKNLIFLFTGPFFFGIMQKL